MSILVLKDMCGGDDVVIDLVRDADRLRLGVDSTGGFKDGDSVDRTIQLSMAEARRLVSALDAAINPLKPQVGDTIRVLQDYWMYKKSYEYTLEEFRLTLGFFKSEQHREAGVFTALSDEDLYDSGPDSKSEYISNFGSYTSNQVPTFEIIRRKSDA